MIKKLLLTFLMCLITLPCFAEKVYIYIDKIGFVAKGEESGHNEKGDVISILPFEKKYKPTRGELGRYKIIVSDLTKTEQEELLEVDRSTTDFIIPGDESTALTIRPRKKRIAIENLTAINQEEEVEKTVITNNTVTKSALTL